MGLCWATPNQCISAVLVRVARASAHSYSFDNMGHIKMYLSANDNSAAAVGTMLFDSLDSLAISGTLVKI
jgi:hypothetical protein